MSHLHGRRPSPALVVSFIALFVALAGTGYAASRISGRELVNHSVGAAKLKRNTLTGAQIRERTLGKVRHARTADSARRLGGVVPGGYQRRVAWALVGQGGQIVRQSGGLALSGHPNNGDYYFKSSTATSRRAIVVTPWWPQSGSGVIGSATPCGFGGDATKCAPSGDASGNVNDGKHFFVETSVGNRNADEGYYVALLP